MSQSITNDSLLTTKGLSAILGHSSLRNVSNWLYQDSKDGGNRAPKHVKINGRIYFFASSVDTWLAAKTSCTADATTQQS